MFKIVFWYWWALAAVLLVCEMMLPGVVFLFLAIGAAVAGAAAADRSGPVARTSARRLRDRLGRSRRSACGATCSGLQPGRPTVLNARGEALVGKMFVLDQPILAGRGRIKLGDGSWIVTGPDMVAGAKVRVAAVSGTELRVEPAP